MVLAKEEKICRHPPRVLNLHPPSLEPFIEADDGALIVRMSPRHLKKLGREGKIPAHPRGEGQRRRWLFLASELHAWMRGKVQPGATETYHLEDFRLRADAHDDHRDYHPQERLKDPPGDISQSERDWAFAKRALARGDDPEDGTEVAVNG